MTRTDSLRCNSTSPEKPFRIWQIALLDDPCDQATPAHSIPCSTNQADHDRQHGAHLPYLVIQTENGRHYYKLSNDAYNRRSGIRKALEYRLRNEPWRQKPDLILTSSHLVHDVLSKCPAYRLFSIQYQETLPAEKRARKMLKKEHQGLVTFANERTKKRRRTRRCSFGVVPVNTPLNKLDHLKSVS